MTLPTARRLPLVAVVALLLLCARAGTPGDILIEAEGQSFNVGSIGERPQFGAGADIDNELRLEGFAPALSVGLTLGPSRRVEARWRGLRDDHVYATALPNLVLEGEQRVARDTLDVLLVQKLGKTPLRLEFGYRYLDLERSWKDAVSVGSPFATGDPDLATLDYSSELSGHGIRGAIRLDWRFLGRLHLDAGLGLSVLSTQESLRSLHTDDSGYGSPSSDVVFDGSRRVRMSDLHVRLRVDVTSRVWLAAGYRYEDWYLGSDTAEYSAGGLTLAVGLRLGVGTARAGRP